ncbi:hypothetical protein L596_008416 [Steinernema carpocapsae]|nr:hypothetical protein L596_008416 [Steinernema carpocapsae]
MTEFERYGLLKCDCSDPDSLQPTLFTSSETSPSLPENSQQRKSALKKKRLAGSAYSSFFRTYQNVIKKRNRNASFGEISKEIATMWISLDESTKAQYKRSSDMKKMEYMKQVALSRAVGMSFAEPSPSEAHNTSQFVGNVREPPLAPCNNRLNCSIKAEP